jgi:hypothetical protein
LLNPRACRYHSFTEFSVDFRERSNMNRIATASLHTKGNIFTNSRCPPRSHIENVMVVRRTEMVFSMKLTPGRSGDSFSVGPRYSLGIQRTQRLDIILIKTTLDILDH